MYKLIYSLIVFTFLISCTPTNNPTPTTTTPPPTGGGGTISTTFQDLQGIWYYTGSATRNSANEVLGFLCKDSNCKIDFTNTPVNNSPSYYELKGNIGACQYPQISSYNYTPTNNQITSFYNVDLINNDTLILSTSSQKYLYNRNISNATLGTVEWEIELNTPYPANNEINFEIRSNIPTANQIIPVVTTQTKYTGSITSNVNGVTPLVHVYLSTSVTNTSQTNPNILNFDVRIKTGSFIISEKLNVFYCIGGDFNTCNGYMPIGSGTGYISVCSTGWQ